MYLISSGIKKTSTSDENRIRSPSERQQTVSLSPSKRRQSTCHYEDLQASPSKRQSTMATKPPKHALLSSERKILFGESTNHASIGLEDATLMDVSLVDLCMCDIPPEVKKPRTNSTRKASSIKTQFRMKAGPTAKRRTKMRCWDRHASILVLISTLLKCHLPPIPCDALAR